MRIKKSAEDGGGTSFADYVWKPVVLIEMKKRGVDLSRHYRQAFDYWTRLVPDRPRYVVLCNFDEFHVYDFDRQIDAPLDKVKPDNAELRWCRRQSRRCMRKSRQRGVDLNDIPLIRSVGDSDPAEDFP